MPHLDHCASSTPSSPTLSASSDAKLHELPSALPCSSSPSSSDTQTLDDVPLQQDRCSLEEPGCSSQSSGVFATHPSSPDAESSQFVSNDPLLPAQLLHADGPPVDLTHAPSAHRCPVFHNYSLCILHHPFLPRQTRYHPTQPLCLIYPNGSSGSAQCPALPIDIATSSHECVFPSSRPSPVVESNVAYHPPSPAVLLSGQTTDCSRFSDRGGGGAHHLTPNDRVPSTSENPQHAVHPKKKDKAQIKSSYQKTKNVRLDTDRNVEYVQAENKSVESESLVVKTMKDLIGNVIKKMALRGIPLLVRQRGSNSSGGPGIATARGRRASTTGGPRRPLSRRQSRRESRRGSKGRRRSSVHPPIHLPIKDGESSEDEREEKPKNPIRRLSRMLSNAGPAIVRRVSKLRRKSLALVEGDQELEDFELAPLRYRPEGLEQLSKATRFTKEELQFMYRGFKQECPTGVISEETFKTIYGKFFPLGDSAMYAHYVFGTLDQDGSGTITFGDFIMGLSVLLKGTLQERVNWIFNLYDINNDGYITKEELIDIVTSIYDLMGDQANPGIDDNTAVHHVDKIFQKLDLNNDGVVTMDEFMEYCSKNESVIHSFNLFDEIQ